MTNYLWTFPLFLLSQNGDFYSRIETKKCQNIDYRVQLIFPFHAFALYQFSLCLPSIFSSFFLITSSFPSLSLFPLFQFFLFSFINFSSSLPQLFTSCSSLFCRFFFLSSFISFFSWEISNFKINRNIRFKKKLWNRVVSSLKSSYLFTFLVLKITRIQLYIVEINDDNGSCCSGELSRSSMR